MSAVARRFLASPIRMSSDVWQVISELICQDDASARKEFEKVEGFSCLLLNDGLFATNPLIVKNKGPRLRVYCLYGEDAIAGDDKNEEPLTWKPTEKEWHAFIPCSSEEFDETSKALRAKSQKFSVYDISKGIPDDEEDSTSKSSASAAVSIDWGALKNL